jgi:hypothetical protein
MRRFVTLVVLFLFTIPFGISISGCHKGAAITYCNGGSTGPIVGQIVTVTLLPKIYGVSLNFSQIGQVSSPTSIDCKGTTESSARYNYGTTDMTIADVNPATGQLCGGTWNRNTGGAIADYTTCNPTNKTGIAYITASTNGVTSNPLPVFVHPVATSVVLGNPTPPANCATSPDPSSNCCPLAAQATVTADPYPGNVCLSQGKTGQLVARVYQNASTLPKDNITCAVGHLTYTAQTPSIVTIDENGVATAQAPGSTVISANLTNAGSTAGFFATCPPTSISLSVPTGAGGTGGGTSVTVTQNNTQPITVLAKDKNGTSLTGLNLTFQSTNPITIPVSNTGTVTPPFPGAAVITAVCQPPTCNPAPFNQIGFLDNGKPVSSNGVTVTTPGTNSTLLYIASTQSLYLVPVDFTTTTIGQPVRLPYTPNSMVISDDGSTIYMGSSNELMVFNATSNSISREDSTITGNVLAVSPDGTTLAFTDPVRQLIYLYTTSGGIQTTYGGVGTHAQFSPDSQTVYITAGSQLLVHSSFTGWTSIPLATPATDVAVVTPSEGAFFAGTTTTARGACPITTQTTSNGQTTTTNVFYPDAGVAGPQTDRVAATNDGKHILGATIAPAPTFTDLSISIPTGPCPPAGLVFPANPVLTSVLPGVTATAITGIVPTSDSAISIVTYNGSGGVLPTYTPAASGPGTLGSVKLSGTAIAPVAGVVSADNTTFYVGTSGDNLVHLINSKVLIDDPTKAIAPKLPDTNGNFVVPNLLVQHPRKSTS